MLSRSLAASWWAGTSAAKSLSTSTLPAAKRAPWFLLGQRGGLQNGHRMISDVHGRYCIDLYWNIYSLECSLHDFNGMKPILRYAWDSCRFLWILQSPNFRCRKTCFSLGNVNSLTRWFQLEMGSSLETEIKVAKLLQKQHWVLLDDFFYSHGRALLTRVWSMVWGV